MRDLLLIVVLCFIGASIWWRAAGMHGVSGLVIVGVVLVVIVAAVLVDRVRGSRSE